MLRLSKLTDYATVILSHMAKNTDHVHSAIGVAEVTGISLPTASKIMKLLVNGKLLVSTRGSNGGYTLARSPECISIADVIAILEGPIGLTECSISHVGCEQASGCEIGANWSLISRVITDALAAVSLADMIKPIPMPEEIFIPIASLHR
jgi:FeS assembly SUF system regulator